MDANLLNQFVLAVTSVFKQVANLDLKKEKVQLYATGTKIIADVATIIGITGHVRGQMVIVISKEIAMKVASAIMMGEPVTEFGELAESGICEIANMIGGDTAQRFTGLGYTTDVAVPSVIKGSAVEIGFTPQTPVFQLEFSSEWGKIGIFIRMEVHK